MLLPRETRRGRLAAAAIPLHLALSLGWAAVLERALPAATRGGRRCGRRARRSRRSTSASPGKLFPRIRALPLLPQLADHVAYGATVGVRPRTPPTVGSSAVTSLRRIRLSGQPRLGAARPGGRSASSSSPLGIAAGAALLAAVLAGSLVAQDRSVERATSRVPAADRTVRLVWGGIASGPGTDVDERRPASHVARSTPLVGSPTRAMLFRTSQSNGHLFDLGADRRARAATCTSGPDDCRSRARPSAARCSSSAAPGRSRSSRGWRCQSSARRRSTRPCRSATLITRETYASVLSSALLLPHRADAAAAARRTASRRSPRADVFAPTFRSYSVGGAAATGRRASVVDRRLRALGHADAVRRCSRGPLALRPDRTARAAATRRTRDGKVAGRRLLLIGGEAAALLLAFAVLAATGLRRDTEAQWRRLTWFGARRWQLVTGSVAEIGVVALVGAARRVGGRQRRSARSSRSRAGVSGRGRPRALGHLRTRLRAGRGDRRRRRDRRPAVACAPEAARFGRLAVDSGRRRGDRRGGRRCARARSRRDRHGIARERERNRRGAAGPARVDRVRRGRRLGARADAGAPRARTARTQRARSPFGSLRSRSRAIRAAPRSPSPSSSSASASRSSPRRTARRSRAARPIRPPSPCPPTSSCART